MKLLQNKENLLYKTIFDCGFVHHYTKIDNNKIKKSLLEDAKDKKDNLCVFNDLELTRHNDIVWILDYIRDYHKTSNKSKFTRNNTLAACKIFLNVEYKNESSQLRHHFNYQEPNLSPKMTVMYFVSGGGELYIKHKTLNEMETWSNIEIKEKMYVVFNSEIPYLRTPNPNEEPRIVLTWPCSYL